MIRFLFLIIVLCSQQVLSQSLDLIEGNNVIFILFDSGKNTSKKITDINNDYVESNSIYNYFFTSTKNNVSKRFPIRFFYFGFLATSQSKYIYFKAHKSFLKKNKNIIVTKEFMDKIGRQKTRELLLEAKTIFLIDKTETRNNKILIKQVVFHDIENI